MSDTLSFDAVPYSPSGLQKAGVNPGPSPATLHRWRLRGLAGIRVRTFLRGGRRFVTRSALAEFFEQVTAARDGVPPFSSNQPAANRDRSLRQAEAELDADGIT